MFTRVYGGRGVPISEGSGSGVVTPLSVEMEKRIPEGSEGGSVEGGTCAMRQNVVYTSTPMSKVRKSGKVTSIYLPLAIHAMLLEESKRRHMSMSSILRERLLQTEVVMKPRKVPGGSGKTKDG